MGRRHNSPNTGSGPLPGERVVAQQVSRIGRQQLSYVLVPISDTKFVRRQYYVTIQNRTYYSKQPIPHHSVERWRKALEGR